MLKVLGTVRPRSLVIAAAIANAAEELGLPDMLITSGNDGQHMAGSKHYSDEALDFRTRHLTDKQLAQLVSVVMRRLGTDYQLIVENRKKPNEHLHIEFQEEPVHELE